VEQPWRFIVFPRAARNPATSEKCNPLNHERILETAVDALSSGPEWRATLDELPVPIYTTDAEGAVTYWNRACVEFAGRQPELGQNRWCVTWKIYTTTGERLPHDQCPMAVAVHEQRTIRDVVAIAARPDGSRRAFRPYPTPLFDADGKLSGAINMLVDVTEEQSSSLAEQAHRCRRLAESMYDRNTSTVLSIMAERFDQTAIDLRCRRTD
jgi:PAS domain S-box-containing protein